LLAAVVQVMTEQEVGVLVVIEQARELRVAEHLPSQL
jgi:hypothetical protein